MEFINTFIILGSIDYFRGGKGYGTFRELTDSLASRRKCWMGKPKFSPIETHSTCKLSRKFVRPSQHTKISWARYSEYISNITPNITQWVTFRGIREPSRVFQRDRDQKYYEHGLSLWDMPVYSMNEKFG
jgi:hypothetical protein